MATFLPAVINYPQLEFSLKIINESVLISIIINLYIYTYIIRSSISLNPVNT